MTVPIVAFPGSINFPIIAAWFAAPDFRSRLAFLFSSPLLVQPFPPHSLAFPFSSWPSDPPQLLSRWDHAFACTRVQALLSIFQSPGGHYCYHDPGFISDSSSDSKLDSISEVMPVNIVVRARRILFPCNSGHVAFWTSKPAHQNCSEARLAQGTKQQFKHVMWGFYWLILEILKRVEWNGLCKDFECSKFFWASSVLYDLVVKWFGACQLWYSSLPSDG